MKYCLLSATLWTAALQAALSMGLSRQEYGVVCHAPVQGIFLTQRLNPPHLCLLHWQVGSSPVVPPGKPQNIYLYKVSNQLSESILSGHMRWSKAIPSGSFTTFPCSRATQRHRGMFVKHFLCYPDCSNEESLTENP